MGKVAQVNEKRSGIGVFWYETHDNDADGYLMVVSLTVMVFSNRLGIVRIQLESLSFGCLRSPYLLLFVICPRIEKNQHIDPIRCLYFYYKLTRYLPQFALPLNKASTP